MKSQLLLICCKIQEPIEEKMKKAILCAHFIIKLYIKKKNQYKDSWYQITER